MSRFSGGAAGVCGGVLDCAMLVLVETVENLAVGCEGWCWWLYVVECVAEVILFFFCSGHYQ
jgi:hypothetical protein